MRCDSGMYNTFSILPITMLFLFTAGFPIGIFVLLFWNRKRLHTASVKAQFGFLYASFRKDRGEFWEVHELFRKLMLMGTLVLLGNTKLKMVVALLVCVVSVANLNYFKPHRSSIVLKVAQASFLLTTFKYVVAIILIDVTEEEKRVVLGGVLVFLDICFVLGSVGSIAAVLYLLKSHANEKKEGEVKVATTKVVPKEKPKEINENQREDQDNKQIRAKESSGFGTSNGGKEPVDTGIPVRNHRRVPRRNSVQHLM